MKYLVALMLIAFIIPSTSFAGEGSGNVIHILSHEKIAKVDDDDDSDHKVNIGVIMFQLESHTNKPLCSGMGWAFNANDAHGKAMYAMLLSAAAQSLSVTVMGSNDCGAWGDRERPLFIKVVY